VFLEKEVFFMTQEDLTEIEGTIGYRFKNQYLLQQAFVRSSYAYENGGEDNEKLEFLGDAVVEYVVTKEMAKYCGKVNKDHKYESRLEEGELTSLRQKMVEDETLAKRIDELGLNDYLIMGQGDIKNHANQVTKVKGSLLEAIVGAVAIDSGFDQKAEEIVVDNLLNPKFYLENGIDANDDYVSELQSWFQMKGYGLPKYEIESNILDPHGYTVMCSLVIPEVNVKLSQLGFSKAKTTMGVAEAAIEFLDKNGLLYNPNDIVKNPSKDNAISQLNQLYQNGYISEPLYEAEEGRDDDNNIVWDMKLTIKDPSIALCGTFQSKKEGKRELAYKALMVVLNHRTSVNNPRLLLN